MDYRATPHSTTGESPSELLHGRRKRTKLQVIGMSVPSSDRHVMRERVKDKRQKMKEYTDTKGHTKTTDLHPGDEVRVKKPRRVKKGKLKFSKPRTVVTKRGHLRVGRRKDLECLPFVSAVRVEHRFRF